MVFMFISKYVTRSHLYMPFLVCCYGFLFFFLIVLVFYCIVIIIIIDQDTYKNSTGKMDCA